MEYMIKNHLEQLCIIKLIKKDKYEKKLLFDINNILLTIYSHGGPYFMGN